MSTNIRPELSSKNKYCIPKDEYYMLVHFCRMYDEYCNRYAQISSEMSNWNIRHGYSDNDISRLPEHLAIDRMVIGSKIQLIEKAARDADPDLNKWILLAVTKGYSFGYLSVKLEMPCSRDMFYDRYRRFFWLLARAFNDVLFIPGE